MNLLMFYNYINMEDLCCYVVFGEWKTMSNVLIWEDEVCSNWLNLSITE